MNIKPFLAIPAKIMITCLAIGGACLPLKAESDLHFRLVDSTLIVVTLNSDRGSFDFVLDTGTDTTVVDPSIASRLSFVPVERMRVVTLSNMNLVLRGTIPSLSAGPFHVHDIPVLVKDLANMRKLDSHIVGIVGQNFLSHFNYLIDYRRHLMSIELGNEIRDSTDGEHVEIDSTENRMMVASEAQSRGKAKLHLVLDSGTHSVVLLRSASQALSIPKRETVLEETSDGQVVLQKGRLQALTVGSQKLHDIAALLLPVEPPVRMGDGLLPMMLFRAVYVNNHEGFVVFNPRTRKD